MRLVLVVLCLLMVVQGQNDTLALEDEEVEEEDVLTLEEEGGEGEETEEGEEGEEGDYLEEEEEDMEDIEDNIVDTGRRRGV